MPNGTLRLSLRPTLIIASFGALYGFTVAIEDFLFLFLHQDSGEGLWSAMGRNLELLPILGRTALYSVLAAASALLLASSSAHFTRKPLEEILARIAPAYLTLLVPVGLSLAAAAALTLSPQFPYGANLAVSLALEGSFDRLLVSLLLLAALCRALAPAESDLAAARRWLGPAVVLTALALFTLATPARFYREGVGQGNMFKYVRMADAVAGSGSLDIAQAERTDASFTSFLSHLPAVVAAYGSESRELIGNLLEAGVRGELYRGERTASRANRSMFRSAAGGTYYINAPGPGLLLVPAHIVDQTLNRWLGWERQIAIIVFWQLLGALLVQQMVLAATEIASRRAAVITGFATALAVPILFYTYQIYPELPGALLLVLAFRKLVLDVGPDPWFRDVLAGGTALAALPWLHQKYSVTAAVLGLYAAYRFLRRTPGGRRRNWTKLIPLALPLALSAYSIFLYNHALTGSLAPTATFDSAGRSSFLPANALKGFSGLLFDRENGLFVFAPIYLFALVGARAFAREHRRILTPFVLVVTSYLLVIASFPYWPGAVSTMGRYILSILPLVALPAALAVDRAIDDGRIAGCGLVLAAASLAYSVSFSRDLVPSLQPNLFWSRALYAEPAQYLPSFLTDGFLGSGPAHFAKFLVLLLFAGGTVYVLRDRVAERGPSVASDADPSHFSRALVLGAGVTLLAVIGLGVVLERWPGNAASSEKPIYRETLVLESGSELWVDGEHGFEGPGVWIAGGGESHFLMHTRAPVLELSLFVTNGPEENAIEVEEHGVPAVSFVLPPGGPHEQKIRLRNPHRFVGPTSASVSGSAPERFLYAFSVRSRDGFVPKDEGRGADDRYLGAYVSLR